MISCYILIKSSTPRKKICFKSISQKKKVYVTILKLFFICLHINFHHEGDYILLLLLLLASSWVFYKCIPKSSEFIFLLNSWTSLGSAALQCAKIIWIPSGLWIYNQSWLYNSGRFVLRTLVCCDCDIPLEFVQNYPMSCMETRVSIFLVPPKCKRSDHRHVS